jgi:hypothetical protein
MDGHAALLLEFYGLPWPEPVVDQLLRIVSTRSQNVVARAHASI